MCLQIAHNVLNLRRMMRTHQQIVRAYGAAALVRDLGRMGVTVHRTTPQRWADRNSIPGEYWVSLQAIGAASVAELAAAADVQHMA